MKPRTCLILYTELAEYFMACVRELTQRGIEVHIVHWKVNAEAPFQFVATQGIHLYPRDQFNDAQLLALANRLSPQIILCSGWVDKAYLKVCKQWKGRAATVLTMDNHWEGSLKQQVASLFGPLFLGQRFTHAWVPGEPQARYASKLGFRNHRILKGFYAADYNHFKELEQQISRARGANLPKRILYLGRYVKHKGIFELWEAFSELQSETSNDWELWCIGTGDQFDHRIEHPKIKHLGFVQPKDLGQYLDQVGGFILPSHFEPWGVVVHEMAILGLPMLCSNAVGAATRFLEEGQNGYSFPPEDKAAIKVVLKKLMQATPKELQQMGQHSKDLAASLTPKTWAATLLQAVK